MMMEQTLIAIVMATWSGGALWGQSSPSDSASSYGRACAQRIAEVPAFRCGDGTLVPITVDGKPLAVHQPNQTCDRPSLLLPEPGEKTDGQCVPNSQALVLRDDEEVQISAFCRQKLIRPQGTHLFDEIDVILHSVENGSTCWFQAKVPNPEGDPSIGVDGGEVPSPTSAADGFWNPPEETAKLQCGGCHDSDPFYYSPFIAQTGELPADPLGLYANDVGAPFRSWPRPNAISTRGNTCTGCHRIGSEHTCRVGVARSVGRAETEDLDELGATYPHSHWMPVDNMWTLAQWKGIFERSLGELARCCADPQATGCIVEPIDGLVPAR